MHRPARRDPLETLEPPVEPEPERRAEHEPRSRGTRVPAEGLSPGRAMLPRCRRDPGCPGPVPAPASLVRCASRPSRSSPSRGRRRASPADALRAGARRADARDARGRARRHARYSRVGDVGRLTRRGGPRDRGSLAAPAPSPRSSRRSRARSGRWKRSPEGAGGRGPRDRARRPSARHRRGAAGGRSGRSARWCSLASADGAGTSLLLRRPPRAIPARFGPDSFRRHRGARCRAWAAGRGARAPGAVLRSRSARRYPHAAGRRAGRGGRARSACRWTCASACGDRERLRRIHAAGNHQGLRRRASARARC